MNNKTKIFGLQKEVELKRQDAIERRNLKSRNEVNAARFVTYSGKRFLGLTPNKQPVWVKLSLNKESKFLTMSTTHNLEILLDKHSLLAQSRLSIKLNQKISDFDLNVALKEYRKNEGGKVTKFTLDYIQRLIGVIELKSYPAFVKNKPTKLFFQYAASCVYPGDSNLDNEITWRDVCTYWSLPTGDYFTMEKFPKVVISNERTNDSSEYQHDRHIKDYLSIESRLS